MAVDRGGLEYDIRVGDRFSREMREFRDSLGGALKDVQRLKSELKSLRGPRSSGRGAVGASPSQLLQTERARERRIAAEAKAESQRAKAQSDAAKARAAEARSTASQTRAQSKEQEQQIRLSRDLVSLAKERARAEGQVARAVQAQAQAQTAQLRARAQIATAEARRETAPLALEQERLRGVREQIRLQQIYARGQQQTVAGSRRALRSQQSLRQEIDRTSRSARTAIPVFNGLFSAILVSEGLRASIDLVTGFITTIIQTSAELEQATLGIASLFTAVGTVASPGGELLEGPEALTAALALAEDQTKKLRIEGLKTAATFQELTEAFQVAVAPGLQAGLSIEEIRKFSVRISQAATAIGLEQRQLAEEIRSIFAGTINIRQTRIAAALGITNADIRQAREAGELAQFLEERFAAFGTAAEQSLQNFTVRLSNLREAFQVLLQQGGVEFFRRVSDEIQALSDRLIDPETLTPSPAALSAVQTVAQGLTNAFETLIETFQDLAGDNIEDVAQTIANGFELAADVISGVVRGVAALVEVFQAAVPVLSTVADIILSIVPGLGSSDSAVQNLAAALTVVAGLAGPLSLISSLLGTVTRLLGALGAGRVAASLGRIVLPFLSLSRILGGLRALVLSLTLRIGSFAAAIGTSAGGAVALASGIGAAAAAAAALAGYAVSLSEEIQATVEATERLEQRTQNIRDNIGAARFGSLVEQNLRGQLGDENVEVLTNAIAGSEKLTKALREAQANLSTLSQELGEDDARVLAARRRLADLIDLRRRALTGDAEAIRILVQDFGVATDAVRRYVNILGQSGDLGPLILQEVDAALKETAQSTRDLLSQLDRGAVVSPVNTELKNTTKILQQLDRELVRVQSRLETALTGSSGQVQALQSRSAGRRVKALEEVAKREQELEEQRARVIAQREAAQARVSSLEDQFAVQEVQRLQARKETIRESIALLEDLLQQQRQVAADPGTTGAELSQVDASIRQIEQVLGTSRRNLRKASREQISIFEAMGLSNPEQFIADLQLLGVAEAQAKELAEGLDALGQERGQVESRLDQIESIERVTFALQQQEAAQEELASAEIELIRARSEAAQKGLSDAQARVIAERANLEILRRQQEIDLQRATQRGKDLRQLLAQVTTLQEYIKVSDAIVENEKVIAALKETQRLADLQQQDVVEDAENVANNPVSAGIDQAIENIQKQADVFANTVQFMTDTVNKFADFASDAIVDALDPTTDTSLRERFGNFLKDIARQLIRIAILRAVALGLGGGAGASAAAAASGIGQAEGGKVPKVRGYSSGGRIVGLGRAPFPRPADISPKDTTPIWAQPGEIMIKKKAVDTYGDDFLLALNSLAIDPSSLTGAKQRRRTRIPRPSTGMADGGEVPVAQGFRRNEALGYPVLVPDNRNVEKFNGGGKTGQVRVTKRNRQAMNAALGNFGQ